MSKPLIIFGAGASFDFLHSGAPVKDWRPPLAKDLFDENYYRDLLNQYPEVAKLASTVTTRIKGGMLIEDVLLKMDQATVVNHNRKSQLIQLRYYLQEMFDKISAHHFNSVNNYNSVIQEIDDSQSEACIVTFNYDSLLEKTIGGFDSLDAYVTGNKKVIKLHGSHDWVYYYPPPEMFRRGVTSLREQLLQNPDLMDKFWTSEVMLLRVDNRNYQEFRHFGLPALAIPLPNKAKYICPESHVKKLKECLRQVDRIIIIGWKGADTALLEMINASTSSPLPTYIVSKGSETEQEIRDRFTPFNMSIIGLHTEGFASYMNTAHLKDFLQG